MIKSLNQYPDFYKSTSIYNTLFIGNNKLIYAGLKQILGNISEDIVLSYSEDLEKNNIINKLDFFNVIIFDNSTANHLKCLKKVVENNKNIKLISLTKSDIEVLNINSDLSINIYNSEREIYTELEDFYYKTKKLKFPKEKLKGENDISQLFKKLSNREFEIARLMIKGYGNLEITNELNLKASTVSTFKSRIFHKLNIINVIQLANKFDEYQYNKCV